MTSGDKGRELCSQDKVSSGDKGKELGSGDKGSSGDKGKELSSQDELSSGDKGALGMKGKELGSQDELGAVVSPPQNEVFLSPLHEVGQHVPGAPVRADEVLVLPDLQPNQHDADVQHDIHLGRKSSRNIYQYSDKSMWSGVTDLIARTHLFWV